VSVGHIYILYYILCFNLLYNPNSLYTSRIENTNQLKTDYTVKLWYVTDTCAHTIQPAEHWLVLSLNSHCCLRLLRCHADINSYADHQFNNLWLLLRCYTQYARTKERVWPNWNPPERQTNPNQRTTSYSIVLSINV